MFLWICLTVLSCSSRGRWSNCICKARRVTTMGLVKPLVSNWYLFVQHWIHESGSICPHDNVYIMAYMVHPIEYAHGYISYIWISFCCALFVLLILLLPDVCRYSVGNIMQDIMQDIGEIGQYTTRAKPNKIRTVCITFGICHVKTM